MLAVSGSTWLIIGIAAVFAAVVVTVVATASRGHLRAGTLSHETVKRDKSEPVTPSTEVATTETVDPRARAERVRRGLARRESTAPAERVPLDEEQIGVSRRQFFNRATLVFIALLGLPLFGVAMLAFLYPPAGAGGFGGKIKAGKKDDILGQIAEKKQPFYVPEARAYVQAYPKDDVPKAKKVYAAPVAKGMEDGVVALYQKCVHLGCRVPWCQSSQWFECPCHGSKYNAVGEKKDGPAPRGLDQFAVEVGGDITIDTSTIYQGVPIGTDTTGQKAEGPSCV